MSEELKADAWSYEVATYRLGDIYSGWEYHITSFQPSVPNGSIRNLTPLYALRSPDAGRDGVIDAAIEAVRAHVYAEARDTDWDIGFNDAKAMALGVLRRILS